jgi:hypothetical protein
MKPLVLLTPLLLAGCLTNPQQMPILTCAGECTYYGPPQRNPNVEMAEVLTGGAVKMALGLANASVLKKAFDGNSSSNTNTIERTTTTNNSVTDRSAVSDVSSSESVSSTSTYISDTSATSVSDTSVSDVSSSVTSIGE